MTNILIIEDDNYMNEVIKNQLEDEGYNCKIIDNADSLLENTRILESYKLVVLDLMMVRGEELKNDNSNLDTGEIIFRIIKESYPKLEIVILTAKNNTDIYLSKSELSNIPVFYKPIDSECIKDFLNVIGERTQK